MKVLFDTSVLVAAMVEPHPSHHQALHWLKRAAAEEINFFVAAHSLAELYAVLTTLPLNPKISSGAAWRLIHENVETKAHIVSLSTSDYGAVIRKISDCGLAGGIIYDALIAKAAEKAGVEKLLTLNANDFRRAWPEGGTKLVSP